MFSHYISWEKHCWQSPLQHILTSFQNVSVYSLSPVSLRGHSEYLIHNTWLNVLNMKELCAVKATTYLSHVEFGLFCQAVMTVSLGSWGPLWCSATFMVMCFYGNSCSLQHDCSAEVHTVMSFKGGGGWYPTVWTLICLIGFDVTASAWGPKETEQTPVWHRKMFETWTLVSHISSALRSCSPLFKIHYWIFVIWVLDILWFSSSCIGTCWNIWHLTPPS